MHGLPQAELTFCSRASLLQPHGASAGLITLRPCSPGSVRMPIPYRTTLDPEGQNPGRKYFPPQSLRQIILGHFLHSSSEPPSPVRTPVAHRVNHPDNTTLGWLPILPCFILPNPLSFSLFTSQLKLPAHQPSSSVLLFGEPRLRHSENYGIDLTGLFQR